MKNKSKPQRIKVQRDPETGAPETEGTFIPDSWVPRRKWFATAVGMIALNVAAALGFDVGSWVVDGAQALGFDVTQEKADTLITTGLGALAGQYVWPEWRNLPSAVRAAVRKLTKGLRAGPDPRVR